MRWVEIEIAAAGDAQEAVGALLTETAGCYGYAATETAVRGYLPVDERVEGALLALKAALGAEITLRFVAEEDWADAWKQYFKPQRIGQRLVVKPGWEDFSPAPGDLVIEIDPGMAFGTGLHATTRLCLRALEECLSPGMAVADIGTGSGILAVAAAKLGAGSVAATDNDPLAVKIARENVARNGVADRVTAQEAAHPPSGPFGLIVANILADVILGMRTALHDALAPGGLLIASGIIDSRADEVRRGLERTGLAIAGTDTEAEWVAIRAAKPGNRPASRSAPARPPL